MHLDPIKYDKKILYSLGLLIADGSISKTNQMSITLHPDDGYILEYVRSALSISNKIKKVSCGNKNVKYCRLTWGYKHSYPYWQKVGMIHNKTNNEIWLPYMENFHFLRGYLDGDGCIYKDNIIFSCGSLRFLQSIQNWIQEYTDNLGFLNKKRGCYSLRYFGKYAKYIGDLIYKDSDYLRLERKYVKYLNLINDK